MSYRDLVDSKKAKLEALKSSRLQREARKKTNDSPSTLSAQLHSDAHQVLSQLGLTLPQKKMFHSQSSSTLSQSEDHALPSPRPKQTVSTQCHFPTLPSTVYSKSTQTYLEVTETKQIEQEIPKEIVEKDEAEITENITLDLSPEEIENIINSDSFLDFVLKSVNVAERVLGEEDKDLFVDYSRDLTLPQEDQEDRLSFRRQFDQTGRPVLSLDWSPQYPELLLAGYGPSSGDPSGLGLVWNLNYSKQSPELRFSSPSPISCILWPKFSPNYIIAGTQCGQLMLWDKRVNRRTPSQRSTICPRGHAHRVQQLSVVGTSNAHNLVSASEDGRVCWWSLDMMTEPIDSFDLSGNSGRVMMSSMVFQPGDINNFLVGTCEGRVTGYLRDGGGVNMDFKYGGHSSLVTSISPNQARGSLDLSPYFLTSSMDWTVKLWRVNELNPLHSFEAGIDNIYAVEWSPLHPALFCSVDGLGRLHLWDLLHDIEFPACSLAASSSALCSCRWHSSGGFVAAGDVDGRIYVYDVAESLPKLEDWTAVGTVLHDMRVREEAPQDLVRGVLA